MHKTTAKGRDKGTAVGFDSVGKRFELHLQNHNFCISKEFAHRMEYPAGCL